MDIKELDQHNICSDISIESTENNYQIKNKDTPNNENDILKLFCSDITKINEKDECNWTPLYRSIISGNLKATEILLKNGANPNIQCSMDETPLYQAVDMEKIDHVKLLLKNGADPNISQIDGLSSLHLAVSKQNIIIIKYLLKYKANPNKQSSLYKQTPVHVAIKNNVDSMILLILVNYGGSLTMKDKFGKMPIDYINSEEMKKTIEMLKLEKNNEKLTIKKIFFTPSKNNKLAISNVISKTIKSESPKQKDIMKQNNIITLKDSSNSKINFIELKSGEKNKKQDNSNENINDSDNNLNENLKINLFNPIQRNNNINYYSYKRAKYFYKNQKFGNVNNNNILDNSNKTAFQIVDSPIQEESSSLISSNKYKNTQNSHNNNNKNLCKSTNTNSNKNLDNKKNNNISHTDIQRKYIKKRSNDKISCFKCESNKKLRRNNTEEIRHRKSITKSFSNKNIQNSRNIKNILIGDINNKNGNILTTNNNSQVDTFSNYKTQLSTNSNKVIKEKSPTLNNKQNANNKKTYNKPKIVTSSTNNLNKDKNNLLEHPLIKAKIMRNKNFFNSKTNRTLKHYPTNKLIPITNKENKTYNYLNNNKENISTNIKNSIVTVSSRNSNGGGKYYNANSFNSSQSVCTYYTYTKNENNTLLEVVEKSKTKNIIYNKESLPIYKWLKEIDLLVYLHLFIKKKIFSFEKIISDLKTKKIVITPNDIKKIGIEIPGHIYRIFVKLEIDAGLIDKKIYEYLLLLKEEEKNKDISKNNKENDESTHSIYDCCGIKCCSLKKIHIKPKPKEEKTDINDNIVFVTLDKWLENIKMIKYKEKFINYGFDKIEFFILQMLSSIPLEEKIFEKELNIENNNDIDLFILQLNKDVKFITHKFKKKRSSSVEVKKDSISKYLLTKECEKPKKKITRTSSNICLIF